jgi:hypothetical protein
VEVVGAVFEAGSGPYRASRTDAGDIDIGIDEAACHHDIRQAEKGIADVEGQGRVETISQFDTRLRQERHDIAIERS